MSHNTGYHRHKSNNVYVTTSDSRLQKLLKYAFSFVTLMLMLLLCVLICLDSVVLSPAYFNKSFTTYEYTAELYEEIQEYALYSCKKANIGDYAAKKVVTFDAVKSLNDAYIGEKLGTINEFTNETYDYLINNFKKEWTELLKQQLQENSIDISDDLSAKTDSFVSENIKYIEDAISLSRVEDLSSITRATGVALKVAAVISAVLVLTFSTIVIYIGDKRYRGVRYIAYSVSATAVVDIAFAIIARLFVKSADLAIYPEYLRYALLSHINYSIMALLEAGMICLAVYAAVLVACWKLKRKNK